MMLNNSDTKIISRPAGGAWFLLTVALLYSIGIGWGAAIGQTLWWLTLVPASVVVGLLLYLTRHRVIADSNGLRWRGAWTGWKSARWAEVSDFYKDSPSIKSTARTVETSQGILTFGANDIFATELAAMIAERAVNAPFGEWQAKGLRPDEKFERRFFTNEISGLSVLLAFMPLVLIFLVSSVFWLPQQWAEWQNAKKSMAIETATLIYIAPLLLMAVLLGLLPTTILALIINRHWLNRTHQIVATQDGLIFEKRGQKLEIFWPELRAIRLHNERARFETTRGSYEMVWISALRPFVGHHAPDATVDDDCAEIDLEYPLPQQNGTAFHSFRTMVPRIFLQILVPMTLIFAGFATLEFITPDLGWPNDNSLWLMIVPMGACSFWLWRFYTRGGIALGEDGLELRGAWRDRFYAWPQIEAWQSKNGAFWIRVNGRRVTLWNWNAPVRRGEVEAEIARRVG